ncbi:MAG TPA: GAF domain-containing protein [Gaiellaceae bacterium]|nr:GAF domain-containing protein [Gaiellaceae bacterium]
MRIATRTSPTGPEERFLHEIVAAVGSTLDLEEVLRGVVSLLTQASAVHACFVYLLDDDAKRLVLAAASDPYGDLAGTVALDQGEGLAWWALTKRRAAFIRENALTDPRVKYVPELEEERFQSLVAVPLLGKRGDPIGAITLHTEAPREFTDEEVELVAASASLVAGAIENAQLYDEARRRVGELEQLTELAEALAGASSLEALGPDLVRRARTLLAAERTDLYLVGDDERLHLRFADPADESAPETIGLAELGPAIGRGDRASRLSISLVAGEELLGALVAVGTSEVELARAVANQAAVAIKKIHVLERLTEKNLIKDFFEELAARGSLEVLEATAARLGFELERPHLVVAATRVDDAFERSLAAVARGALVDRRDGRLRAIVPVGPAGGAALVAELARIATPALAGVSSVCVGAEALGHGFEEAEHALLGAAATQTAGGVVAYDDLGAHKYLLRIARESSARDATIEAVEQLAEYDRERGASLLVTLEEFLRRRGNISATSDVLYVHPNTLRQRLRRIADLTGIDLRRDDWLMVEIAVKLVRLRAALAATPHT